MRIGDYVIRPEANCWVVATIKTFVVMLAAPLGCTVGSLVPDVHWRRPLGPTMRDGAMKGARGRSSRFRATLGITV